MPTKHVGMLLFSGLVDLVVGVRGCCAIDPTAVAGAASDRSRLLGGPAGGENLAPGSQTRLDIGEQKRHYTRKRSRRHGIASAQAICPSRSSVLAVSR